MTRQATRSIVTAHVSRREARKRATAHLRAGDSVVWIGRCPRVWRARRQWGLLATSDLDAVRGRRADVVVVSRRLRNRAARVFLPALATAPRPVVYVAG